MRCRCARWECRSLVRQASTTHLEDALVPDVVHVQVEVLQVRALGDVRNRLRALQRDAAHHRQNPLGTGPDNPNDMKTPVFFLLTKLLEYPQISITL